MALTPVGLGSERPVLGSDYLRNIAQSLGLAQPSTGSGAETAGRFGAAFVNPAAGARAVGQASQAVTRGANLSADKLVQMITGNPQATAPRVLEETSMPFMQAMAPKAPAVPGLMEPAKSDIGFYSQLEAATIPLQNKGTGDQYLAQIQKSAGVKPEEIQWTGLDEFLKGKKSVTKQEIQDYLQANRVDVQEVRLDRSLPVVQAERRGAFAAYDRGEITLEQRNAILEQSEPVNTRHHLGAYQGIKTEIPGGENYREILLTLPSSRPSIKNMSRAEYNAAVEAADRAGVQDFLSTHFDQPNILAHMRVNDRVVDGKRTLFIEEIQSDWHQAGRKKGYATSEKAELPEGTKVFEPGAVDSPGQTNQAFTVQIPRAVNGRSLFYGTTREEALANAQSFIAQPSLGAVPDAPFKTSWHELTLKRAIQEASEKGYDQIAFTTGKTQAERYDLSKQVNKIDVEAVEEVPNLYFVDVDVAGGKTLNLEVENGIVRNDEFAGKALEDVVGKEIAEKVMSVQQGKTQRLSGDDLRIGGEGMKGFYDQILPKSLEKLGKKFDAKVGKTFIEGERTRDADGFPSMYPEKIEVWKMDITPKMRESVTTKGQPLFAVPAIGAGLLGAGMYQDEQMF